MFKIVGKQELAKDVFEFVIEAPRIAGKADVGQFVVVRASERDERLPLTINEFQPEKGLLTLVCKAAGATTKRFCALNKGDEIRDVVGPLGKKAHIQEIKGTVVCVGAGMPGAALAAYAKAHHEAGNQVIAICAAKDKYHLFYTEKLEHFCKKVIYVTEDGSRGMQGTALEALQALLEEETPAGINAMGSPELMKEIAAATKAKNIRTYVALHTVITDGLGMCGGCRVDVGGKVMFTCTDGPEFDGHLVEFDNFIARRKMYCEEEHKALAHVGHSCNLGLQGGK